MAKVLIGNFKGPQGEQGVKGDPGAAATIQVGTTQTVQPEANAEVTNSGTANAAVLNFKIPRGEDGMTDLTAEYKDASEYTCQPTVNAPVVLKEISGKTEQGADPSPDNPQVIKGVGGMGYFDGEWRQGLYLSTDGNFSNVNYGICSQNYIPCKKNDVIKIEYGETEPYLIIIFYNANKNYISASNNSVSGVTEFQAIAPEGVAYFMIDVQYSYNSTITPSTAKYCTVTINGEYQTEIKSGNINLWNGPEQYTGSVQISSTFDWTGKDEIYIEFDALTDNTDGQVVVNLDYYNENGTRVGRNGIAKKVSTSFTHFSAQFNGRNSVDGVGKTDLTKIKYMTAIFEIYQNSASEFSVKNVMFSDEQLTDVTYVSRKEFTLSIPLTSPLYEGDKICYVKPGESYVVADGTTVIADRIFYGCYRENAVVVFDGSEDEAWYVSSNLNYRYFIKIPNAIREAAYCNYFIYDEIANINGVFFIDINKNAQFVYSEIVNDASAWKTWLQSNPLTVVYKLAQPYFEPFVDQSIFYTLRTDDTLSYVYSSDPIEPVLTVEVAKNSTGGYLLESYAQAQKNAISEANSQSRISAIEQQLVNQATTPTE